MTYHYSKIKWTEPKLYSVPLVCMFLLILLLQRKYTPSPDFVNTIHQEEIQAPWSIQLANLATSKYSRQSLYTPSMFTPDALNNNHFRPITAIILRTHQDQGIHHIVDHLHKYPFFKEISIYNLHSSSASLSPQLFERPNPWLLHKVDINIIDEKEQDHDGMLALFTTCALSTYDQCYIQDDHALNFHLDSLYTHYMRYPDLIHVNARSEEYLTHRRWQLYHQDETVHLHTGYANLRHGAIIPRSKAQLFLNQFAVQKTILYQRRMADVFFSLWSNSYPYIVSNPLNLATEQNPPYHQMLNAVRRLEKALSDKLPYFDENDIGFPLKNRDVRTACENDKCLFVTNLDPFPLTTGYDSNQNLTNSSLGSSNAWQHELDIPGSEFWLHRGYHAAVDGDSSTCWNSYLVPKEGDYFGLDLVGNMRASRLLIQLRQPMQEQQQFKVRAEQQDGWVDCAITLDASQSLPRRPVYQMQCPDDKPFRAIRLFFLKQHDRSFDLCGLGLDNFIL
ncbi:uncharacterized protein BX664DRAFT_333980 [Halteromyces radiatus]|uniref:uncharacterized protein n=1 Tax=Halteromyces radiatus TaxID=101107 RepID=UPI0022202731|nr:uncharacterized protein BX664DRAFT_333980 [Halteromyces radiatus]KAI8089816.1 hypothetical protein BX664DRAFT_333980 [Halteromyces radiatus]